MLNKSNTQHLSVAQPLRVLVLFSLSIIIRPQPPQVFTEQLVIFHMISLEGDAAIVVALE